MGVKKVGFSNLEIATNSSAIMRITQIKQVKEEAFLVHVVHDPGVT